MDRKTILYITIKKAAFAKKTYHICYCISFALLITVLVLCVVQMSKVNLVLCISLFIIAIVFSIIGSIYYKELIYCQRILDFLLDRKKG